MFLSFVAVLGVLDLIGTLIGFDLAGAVFVVGAIGALLVGLGMAMLLGVEPIVSSDAVELEVEPLEACRGDTVAITVRPRQPGVGVSSLRIGLVCVERADAWFDSRERYYPGLEQVPDAEIPHRGIVEEPVHESWQPLESAEERRVLFEVPGDAPYSYEGDRVSFAWRAAAKHAGEFSEREVHVPFWVSP